MSNYKIKDRQLSEDFVLPVEKGGRVNPNLLHNWYFGNPVNRNGKTEYNKSGWNIDRWYASISTGGSVNLIDDAIQIIGGTNNTSFRQYVDVPIAEAYTCSFLCEITGGMAYMQTFYTDGTAGKYIYTASNGLFSFTDTSQKQINRVQFGVEAGVTLTLYACKLELGDTQTLAHQNEEGNWVLNEIPDFGEQYAICCQYDKTSGEYLGLTPEAIGARPSTWMPSANDVGAVDLIDANSPDYDMDAIIKNKSLNGLIYKTTSSTLGTPHAKGVTALADAIILNISSSINYGAQIAFMSGGQNSNFMLWRTLRGGTISDWTTGFIPLDGSVSMSGNLGITNATWKKENPDAHALVEQVGTGHTGLYNMTKDSTYVGYRLRAITDETTDITDVAELRVRNSAIGNKQYTIFGEHNKELLSGEEYSLPVASGFGNSNAYYRKDAAGYVHLRGNVTGVTTLSTIFATLPVGYRPYEDGKSTSFRALTTQSGGGGNASFACRLEIWTGGNIVISDSIDLNKLKNWVSLDGISFYAGV